MKLFVVALATLCLAFAEDEKKEEKDEVGTVIGIDLGTTYSWLVNKCIRDCNPRDFSASRT